jgi:hypothetical protein
MGWTHCFDGERLPNGKIDRRRECDKLLTWDTRDKSGELITTNKVLKSAMVGSVYYAAVESRSAYGARKVWAAVFLTCGKTKHDHTEWGYKDMDESVGTYYYDCPASILALLTPTDNKNANEWREQCRKRLAEKAERRKNGPKPLYAPQGVQVDELRGSWIITSSHYRATNSYSGVRYTKARWHEFERAMYAFLLNHGTKEERAEWAASGRTCPTEWKGAAA